MVEEKNANLEEKAKEEQKALSKIQAYELNIEEWNPKTKIGRLVKEGKIDNIDYILSNGYRILEPEIVDFLLPNLKIEFIRLALSKGKFRRPKLVKMVQRKTAEGNKTSWVSMAVVGDENGHVGVGIGKADDVPKAMDKAVRNAKLNVISIARGCGSWECDCGTPHSIPFKVEGKKGSVRVVLLPAPRGVGLVASDEIKKVLRLAGIRDVWTQSFGQTRRRINFVGATYKALENLSIVRIPEEYLKISGLKLGSI